MRFLLRGGNYGVFLTDNQAVFSFIGDKPGVLRFGFPNAHPSEVRGLDAFPGRIHYATGRDSAKSPDSVSTFQEVFYRNLYPGIDLVFHPGDSSLAGC